MIRLLSKLLEPQIIVFTMLPLLSIALLSCEPMRNQPSFRPEEPPRLAVPADAVPVTGVAVEYSANELQNLANPVLSTPESIRAGEATFKTYCVMCHGLEGKGDGPVGKHFNPPPVDLTARFVGLLSDGQLFGMISDGFGRMPPFKYDLDEQQRWELVNYVRTLQQ